MIALDSTTVSTYSENQREARQGFNKDRDGLPAIKLLTLYSVKDREPIAFAKQPGNIPDVISVKNAIAQMKCLGIDNPLIGSTVSKQPRLKQKRSTLAGLLKPPNKIVYFFPCSAFGKCSGRIRRLSGWNELLPEN
ncbi:MAG: hypothetical protein PHS41_01415 [Victivallaceae bacterium]|nr:hypothetical protein [Victivallaceae bacterium]